MKQSKSQIFFNNLKTHNEIFAKILKKLHFTYGKLFGLVQVRITKTAKVDHSFIRVSVGSSY